MAQRSLLALLFFDFLASAHGQSISTSITVPPLQWINLTNLLQGSTQPPALKDASIGYDETSRNVIIFGGESEGGFAQSQTYLLNLDSLSWSVPDPPASLQSTPSARSAAIAGCDFAASNRQGFVVVGGKGDNSSPLSDVWEFDFTNQFWAEVSVPQGGPSARWGAAGGIDIRTSPVQDPVVAGPNNTVYLAGGTNGTTVNSLSTIWRLNISGTLSSNLPNDSSGYWDEVTIGDLPSRTGTGNAVLYQQIIAIGGCDSDSGDASCVMQDSYVINAQTRTEISPSGCPAPRTNPVVVPNVNSASTSFSSQIFLLLGTIDESLWSDDGGLEKGEVAILDVNTGSWSRILPSGDPGDSGTQAFPSPRQGSSAFAYSKALVGGSRSNSSDTIIFGGQDASGQYLSDVWILRAYSGTITSSNLQWSGYGTGALETGVNASGAHVTVEYMTKCASALTTVSTSSGSSKPSSTSTSTSTASSSPSSSFATPPLYDTSFYHKLFAPLSLTLFLPALLLFRTFSSSFNGDEIPTKATLWVYLSAILTVASYGTGIAAIALSFTTISSASGVTKRDSSSSINLKTVHGQVGLAFFIGLYGLVPILTFISVYLRRRSGSSSIETEIAVEKDQYRDRTNSEDSGEKAATSSRDPNTSITQSASRPGSPRPRSQSLNTSNMMKISNEGRPSSDSDSLASGGPQRGFEVVNRPSRRRKPSDSWLNIPQADASQHAQRTLAGIDWLQRRRSLNAVDELDYAITQVIRAQQAPSNAGVNDILVPSGPSRAANFPPFVETTLHILLHMFLLGLCIIALIALWSRAPRATFAVFLAWTACFYAALILFAWHGRPRHSILAVVFSRLRSQSYHPAVISAPPTPNPPNGEGFTLPTDSPYLHQPSYRPVASDMHDGMSYTQVHRSVDADDDDDDQDEDEDTRQQRIENEIGRREVSIVTVPKRKLWITNPS
ncbi:uncharacterized protein BT62DRAFT_929205 [Guyanagaster necrorhizus]|uniref:Uncharacterized protein n=1 Tax=Guyanagaster necrorhizus TaxID=856835 RepID=A0A9P7W0Q2_9AGAR|nr:uncharacterized protein BT62DRAFT_929205 [Guyanagaster necrorhizus MCA 3950]KAG7449231.1 hypothetical protein BT62DRAFT_929205 [Guyanagaster necrorhizus MCA 3950]